MKKIALFLLLTTILLFVSCTQNQAYLKLKKEYAAPSEPTSDYSAAESESTTSGTTSETKFQLPKIDNQTPYEKLLTKEIDIHAFMERHCSLSVFASGDMKEIVDDIGIECLRESETGTLYSIHKVKQGGLLYIFYVRISDTDYWTMSNFYVQKKLSSQNFSGIKEGDSFNKVKQIDPIAQIGENLYIANPSYWEKSGGCGNYHYLSDGVLEVTFKKQNGMLTVIHKKLFDFSEIPQMGEKNQPYIGKILGQDWVK